MNRWRHEELAAVVAAAHADSLVAEVERYLAAVVAFDAASPRRPGCTRVQTSAV